MQMDSQDTMQGDTGGMMDDQEPDAPEQGGEDEATSVFLPKTAFGGKPPKVGDSLSNFKVVDVDPETGDAECKLSDEPTDESQGDMMDAFDSAIPKE